MLLIIIWIYLTTYVCELEGIHYDLKGSHCVMVSSLVMSGLIDDASRFFCFTNHINTKGSWYRNKNRLSPLDVISTWGYKYLGHTRY